MPYIYGTQSYPIPYLNYLVLAMVILLYIKPICKVIYCCPIDNSLFSCLVTVSIKQDTGSGNKTFSPQGNNYEGPAISFP
jgi:hypothetical protein